MTFGGRGHGEFRDNPLGYLGEKKAKNWQEQHKDDFLACYANTRGFTGVAEMDAYDDFHYARSKGFSSFEDMKSTEEEEAKKEEEEAKMEEERKKVEKEELKLKERQEREDKVANEFANSSAEKEVSHLIHTPIITINSETI